MKIFMIQLKLAPVGFWVLILGFLINLISAQGWNGRMYDWQVDSKTVATIGAWICYVGGGLIAGYFITVIYNNLKKK